MMEWFKRLSLHSQGAERGREDYEDSLEWVSVAHADLRPPITVAEVESCVANLRELDRHDHGAALAMAAELRARVLRAIADGGGLSPRMLARAALPLCDQAFAG
ncbi:MAG: hypothetical protein JOY99_13130 [Sphingomonadaceae bacterium]|nr:hypothetical protein [Sphingomonadaceae bacterium]